MIVSRWENQGKKKDSPRAIAATLAAASAYTTSEIAGRSGRSVSALSPKKCQKPSSPSEAIFACGQKQCI